MPTKDNVTWVMPALNSANYIEQTLSSISEVVPSTHEVIVYDNGSTDDTVKIAKSWIGRKISGYVVENKPLSLGLSRQRLLELAKHDWVRLLDSDDIVTGTGWEKQLELLQKNSVIGAVGTQMQLISECGRSKLGDTAYPVRPVDVHLSFLSLDCPVGNPSVMLRKEAALSVGGYKDVILEDHEFWLRMLRDFDICNLPESGVDYRLHPSSYTHKNARAGIVGAQQVRNLLVNHSSFGLSQHQLERFLKGNFSIVTLFRLSQHFSKRYQIDSGAVYSLACSLRSRFHIKTPYGIIGRTLRKALRVTSQHSSFRK